MPYDDNVYCLTLEKNHIMLVRRNDRAAWSGNCFREYVAQLVEYDKKFIIIGNINAITYKEFFPLLKDDKVWPGWNEKGGTRKGNTMLFAPAPGYESKSLVDGKDGKKFAQVSAWWFTNIDTQKRHTPMDLYMRYHGNEDHFPKYDNYDAINVDKTCEIPEDYDGVMGVPITFLDKYCPEQFEVVGLDRYTVPSEYLVDGRVAINGKPKYARILIRRR